MLQTKGVNFKQGISPFCLILIVFLTCIMQIFKLLSLFVSSKFNNIAQ